MNNSLDQGQQCQGRAKNCREWRIFKQGDNLNMLCWRMGLVALVLITSACAPLQTRAPVSDSSPTGGQSGVSIGDPKVESKPGVLPKVQPKVLPKVQPNIPPKKIMPVEGVTSPAQKAVTSLLEEGWSYYRTENHERSISIAERAQRLDPLRAEVYLLLANNYFAQGQNTLAEQLSRRGLSVSQGDAAVRRQLQSLLVKIQAALL